MQIQPSSSGTPAPRRSSPSTDITRPNREGIADTVGPIPSEPEVEAEATQKDRLANARSAERQEAVADRAQNAREVDRAKSTATRIQNARAAEDARNTADRIQNARTHSTDRIDVSPSAERLAEIRESTRSEAPERQARIQELRELIDSGKYNTPERIERAAESILEGGI